jgi:hypothetical protein
MMMFGKGIDDVLRKEGSEPTLVMLRSLYTRSRRWSAFPDPTKAEVDCGHR